MRRPDGSIAALLPTVALAIAAYHLGAQRARSGPASLAQRHAELQARYDHLARAERLAGIGQFVWNVDRDTLWWSDNCYRLYGLDPREGITVERSFAMIHPDDAERAKRVTAALLDGMPPTEIALRIVRPDGEVRHMLSSGELCLEDGERRVFGFMKDATELEDARARLLRTYAHYRFLFEHNPVPMWVLDRDTQVFLAINDAALEHFGYTRDEFRGASLDRVSPPEHREALREAIRAPLSTRTQGEVWTYCRRDGSRRRMAVFAHDIDVDGRPARLTAAQDVTERERNDERFRLIARATSDAVYDYNVESGELWWGGGGAFYPQFGDGPGAMPSTIGGWEQLLHPDDHPSTTASLARALADPQATEWTAEYRLRRTDGTYARVVERGLFLRDPNGHATRMVGGLVDVTRARRREARLRLLERAVEAADNGILITDARGADRPIVYVNPAFERMTGYTAAEVVGRNPRLLQGSDRGQPATDAVRHALACNHEARALLRNYRKDGTLFWNEMYIAPVRDERGALTHHVGVLTDVTDRQQFEDRLAHRATHDELTGLPNRILLEDRLQQAVRVAERGGTRVVVVFIDLDDFKLVNDSIGHGVGDLLLHEVARRLQGAVRDTDTVSRLGGDEFVAVLQVEDPSERPRELVERLARTLSPPMQLDDVRHLLTASIGYCCAPADGVDADTLLRHADQAMYEAKRRGRNRAVAYRREFDTTVSRRLQLIGEVRTGLERGEFELAFQPQYAAGGHVTALEALVRWRHPARGLLEPAEFIAVCEESGLIVELGRHVLREAMRHHRRLVEAGRGDVRIAVNVSAAQFTDDLRRDVLDALDGEGLVPGILELELTESVIMDSPGHAIELMHGLVELGVTFSVDDFGTGYSSLAYLKRFPIQRLKIDRSFVQDLDGDTSDAAICQSIISLAHALELGTVAEGVETEAQRAWLRARGCDELQGYLWGRPQPLDALLPALRPH
jgi:diguanylate cyclase (GGDEF)-like protein/PAS domain S-box-containing protein